MALPTFPKKVVGVRKTMQEATMMTTRWEGGREGGRKGGQR